MNRYYLPLLALLGCAGIAYATGSITVTGYPPVPRTIKGGTGINISADGTVTATGEAVSIGSQPFQNISTALHGKFLPLAGTAVNSADAQAYKGNSAPSGTEFSYLQGVTSAIQTQLNGKADTSGLSTVATTGSYTDLANKPTIPSALSELSGDSTHQVVTDAEKAAWTGKQAALGFTPENAANKGAVNGYPSLDSGGKIPTAQIPTLNQNTTGTAAGLTAAYIDWSLSSGGASIKNKPNLSTVATSGNYSDLSGKPAPYTLPTASTIVKGGVMVDGSSIQIDGAGVIHSTVSAGVSEVNGQTGEVSLDINDIVGFDGYSTAVNNKLALKLNADNPTYSGTLSTSEPDGKHWSSAANTNDTDTTGWGVSEKGRKWFNATLGKERYWDGSAVKDVIPVATASTQGIVQPGPHMTVANGVLDVMVSSLGPSGLVTAGLAGDQTVSSGFAYVATATPWKATFNSYSSTKQTTVYAFGNYSGTLAAATGSKLYWSNPVTFALQSSASAKVKAGTRATVQMSGGKTLVSANQNLQKIVLPPTDPYTTYFSNAFACSDGAYSTIVGACTADNAWTSVTGTTENSIVSGKYSVTKSATSTSDYLTVSSLANHPKLQLKFNITPSQVTSAGASTFISQLVYGGSYSIGVRILATTGTYNKWEVTYKDGAAAAQAVTSSTYTFTAGHTYSVRLVANYSASTSSGDGSLTLYISDNGAAETTVASATGINTYRRYADSLYLGIIPDGSATNTWSYDNVTLGYLP